MTEMTKEVLAQSLKKLMGGQSLEKIRVQDIVNGCSLNRRTFYYHFRDVYDLLGWLFKKEAVEELKKHATYSNWQEGFLGVFRYIQENRAFCLCAFRSLGREHLEEFLYSMLYQLIMTVVEEEGKGMGVKEDRKAFLANFFTLAFIALAIQWMQNGMEEKPERLIANLSTTVRGSMKLALEQYRQDDSRSL